MHLYILLSPYLCFISFLYLVLYVLGDGSWISKGSFMQAMLLLRIFFCYLCLSLPSVSCSLVVSCRERDDL